MGGVTACNWEGKEGPRKVGGIAAGKEKKKKKEEQDQNLPCSCPSFRIV